MRTHAGTIINGLTLAVAGVVAWSSIASAASIVVRLGAHESVEAAASGEGVDWSDGSAADDTICTEAFAALELQHYLRRMCGRDSDFSVMRDDAAIPAGDLIVVGGPATNSVASKYAGSLGVAQSDLDALGAEGYVLKTATVDGRQVILAAGGGRVGTLYAAYDLLHRLGVRWYAPGEMHEEIPVDALDEFPEFDIQETPRFFTRGFHAWEDRGDPEFILWMARNRLNYWCVDQKEKGLLHKLGIQLVGGGHVLTEYYLSPRSEYPYDLAAFQGDEGKAADPYAASKAFAGDGNNDGKVSYFEAHPEWYALLDGKRSDRIESDFGDNFCTSNADAMREWTSNAVEDLAEGRYKDATIINAWALDVGKWCACGDCVALGSPTDRNILLVYHYDKAIKEAQSAGRINRPMRLLFLAYADVIEPPTRPLPEDFDYETCIATYFPIHRNYVYAIDDPRSTKNAEYLKHLEGWAMAPDRHYHGQICIGEYYNVSGYKCLPLCFMHTMQTDIPFYYREMGARHFHYMHCTTRNWGNKALTNWQMARQLWNPEIDCVELWEDYFAGRYGAAAGPMRSFYSSLEKMFANVTELKYGLASRLNRGEENLFPNNSMKYEAASFDIDDGPDMVEIVAFADECRAALEEASAMDLPERVAYRIAEDERLFAYGERTVQFYDALCRAYAAVRSGKRDDARAALGEAETLAALLREDIESTRYSSSHASAANALEASRAEGALTILREAIDSGGER